MFSVWHHQKDLPNGDWEDHMATVVVWLSHWVLCCSQIRTNEQVKWITECVKFTALPLAHVPFFTSVLLMLTMCIQVYLTLLIKVKSWRYFLFLLSVLFSRLHWKHTSNFRQSWLRSFHTINTVFRLEATVTSLQVNKHSLCKYSVISYFADLLLVNKHTSRRD